MHTLFDFVSRVNAIQYGLALLFIFGFIVFTEIFKARPFAALKESASDDVQHLKNQDKQKTVQFLKNAAMAPLYLAYYIAAVPVLFIQGMAEPIGRGIGSVGWSPVRAYFAGRRKAKRAKGDPGKGN